MKTETQIDIDCTQAFGLNPQANALIEVDSLTMIHPPSSIRRSISRAVLGLVALFVLNSCNSNPPLPDIHVQSSERQPIATITSLSQPLYDINDCSAADGFTFFGDTAISNQRLCYEDRAEQLNDWQSCLMIDDSLAYTPAQCLLGVSSRTRTYLCDKHNNQVVVSQCNQTLMVNLGRDPALHGFRELEKFKTTYEVLLKPGDDFTVQGRAVEISEPGEVIIPDYYPESSHICVESKTNPLPVGTGVVGSYIYITECESIANEIQIHYFMYRLSGLSYPEHLMSHK